MNKTTSQPLLVPELERAGNGLLRKSYGLALDDPGILRIAIPSHLPWQASIHDERLPQVRITPGVTAIHVLGCVDETTSSITIDGAPHRILPGDTVTLPEAKQWQLSTGIVALVINGATHESDRLLHPTHGLETFDGFNRRTICSASTGLLVERWKLTQPLNWPIHPAQPQLLVGIYGQIGLAWRGGADSLSDLSARILQPELNNLTLIPNSLAYAVIVRVPDLERDVINPLSIAGFNETQIASLSVHH